MARVWQTEPEMREVFHDNLGRLGADLADMGVAAAGAMRAATKALLTADLALAEQVLTADTHLDVRRAQCEEAAYALLALQAPVARDLRRILAVIYCAERIERMGDLAAHIADTVRHAHPAPVVPDELDDVFAELGDVTARMADRVVELVRSTADGGFAELRTTDETVNSLHARVLTVVTSDQWRYGQRPAVAVALATRFYERFADQAVSIARRLEFVDTGSLPV
ncbi:phosphate signaling complex protein PhoU [Kibdelosporangium lantanae]